LDKDSELIALACVDAKDADWVKENILIILIVLGALWCVLECEK
jgi:hypothetical protein